MSMSPIQPLWDQMPLQLNSVRGAAESKAVDPFTDVFRSAIDAVRETEAEVADLEYLMGTGQLDNPALLSVATAKADLAIDLLLQLRTRAMEAYNELTRINV